MICSIFHEHAALLKLTLQKYVQDDTTDKTWSDYESTLRETFPTIWFENFKEHKDAKSYLHHCKN